MMGMHSACAHRAFPYAYLRASSHSLMFRPPRDEEDGLCLVAHLCSSSFIVPSFVIWWYICLFTFSIESAKTTNLIVERRRRRRRGRRTVKPDGLFIVINNNGILKNGRQERRASDKHLGRLQYAKSQACAVQRDS